MDWNLVRHLWNLNLNLESRLESWNPVESQNLFVISHNHEILKRIFEILS